MNEYSLLTDAIGLVILAIAVASHIILGRRRVAAIGRVAEAKPFDDKG